MSRMYSRNWERPRLPQAGRSTPTNGCWPKDGRMSGLRGYLAMDRDCEAETYTNAPTDGNVVADKALLCERLSG